MNALDRIAEWLGLPPDWRRLDDRTLCRRLRLEGFEHLHAARAKAPSILWFGGSRGEPSLAERVLRLYGGDPQARLSVLPESVPESPGTQTFIEVPFRDGSAPCSLRLAEQALRQGAALLPIFGRRVHGDGLAAFRVVIGEALLPLGTDAASLTRRAVARIETLERDILGRR